MLFDFNFKHGLQSLSHNTPLRFSLRTISNISNIQSCQAYLNYSRQNNININSTLFRGTLYELLAKQLMSNLLNCRSLMRVGGSFDQGIDIFGKWNLANYWHALDPKPANITNTKLQFGSIRPLLRDSKEYNEYHAIPQSERRKLANLSLENDVNILVQCKNYDTKIKPATIREISGLYHHHVNTKQARSRTFMFLVSPRPLTYLALKIVDSLPIPMIHCKLSILKFDKGDIYSVSNWNGGEVEALYMNAVTRALLTGLNLELEFEKIKSINM
mmetsp:Transcript_6402/g.8004  ORF Transcript_6402/g.8004 Transcript_6402/m.8004 type:complete len:273 (+) Transcript_6402:791-1609(+)